MPTQSKTIPTIETTNGQMNGSSRQTFQVNGIACLDCAAQFEKSVGSLPGVNEAVLNTATGKLTVTGHAALADVQHLGKSENYTITEVGIDQSASAEEPSYKSDRRRVIASGAMLLAGYIAGKTALPPTVSAVLFTLAIIAGGWSNFRGAYYSIQRFNFSTSVLMSVAVIGAVGMGEWLEGAVVAFLFGLSDMLESWTMVRARRAIGDLMENAPQEAVVLRNGEHITVPVQHVAVGETILIRPGAKISLDGVVQQGVSTVNEAAITGESTPAAKQTGDTVYAGTLNVDGALEVTVTKKSDETTYAKIVELVEEAQTKKMTSQSFIERFSAVYTPIVMATALAIIVLPPLFTAAAWTPWLYRGLTLLIVACPCALAVAAPVTIVSAISNAARHGVLIKGGNFLEAVGSLQAIAFDKTGTLTRGEPVVTDVVPVTGSQTDVLQLAAGLEAHSEHPLARAIVQHAQQQNVPYETAAQFTAVVGRGAQGVLNGQTVYIGNAALYADRPAPAHFDKALTIVQSLQQQGKTAMIVADDETVHGVIAVADEIRPASAAAVRALNELHIRPTVMLTGDNEQTAAIIAQQAGVSEYEAQLLPADKVAAVERLQQKHRAVGMVGDGINDAPALAAATVGIAMGGAGTDIAMETADVVLMADDLSKLPFTVKLSRRAMRVVKQNIGFALAIKAIALLAVFPGWLTLWLAILSDMGATVIVSLNGMRLLRWRE